MIGEPQFPYLLFPSPQMYSNVANISVSGQPVCTVALCSHSDAFAMPTRRRNAALCVHLALVALAVLGARSCLGCNMQHVKPLEHLKMMVQGW